MFHDLILNYYKHYLINILGKMYKSSNSAIDKGYPKDNIPINILFHFQVKLRPIN